MIWAYNQVVRRMMAISTMLTLLLSLVLCASAQCPLQPVADSAHPCCPNPDSHPSQPSSAQDCPYLLLQKAKAKSVALFGPVPMATAPAFAPQVAVFHAVPKTRTSDDSGLYLRIRVLLI
jgi:hypothetical protein